MIHDSIWHILERISNDEFRKKDPSVCISYFLTSPENLMKITNSTIFIFALFLAFILFALLFHSFDIKKDTGNNNNTGNPASSQIVISPADKNLISGQPAGENNAAEGLTAHEKAAKDFILQTILHGYQSGIVYHSKNIQIEYAHDADSFEAEILTTDIELAKAEAISWFKAYGIKDKGICNLPLQFYLNLDIKNKLRESNTTFNTLPEGC